MTEEIRRAVIHAVSERFHLPVYGQKVPKGGKKPCFTVEIKQTEQKRLLGRRAARRVTAAVNYICGEEKMAAADTMQVLEELYEVLCIIGGAERFAAGGMTEKKTAEGIELAAEYEYHVIFEEEAAEPMGRLKYNGKEAVGYEEKGNLQQRTAE